MFVHTLHFSVTLDVCEFAKLRVAVDGKTSHWTPAAKAAFLNFVIATREPSARAHPTSRMTCGTPLQVYCLPVFTGACLVRWWLGCKHVFLSATGGQASSNTPSGT